MEAENRAPCSTLHQIFPGYKHNFIPQIADVFDQYQYQGVSLKCCLTVGASEFHFFLSPHKSTSMEEKNRKKASFLLHHDIHSSLRWHQEGILVYIIYYILFRGAEIIFQIEKQST